MAKEEKYPLHVKAIIELLGTPKEHLIKSMELLVEDIRKKFSVTKSDIKEPIKHTEKFFSSFIDFEFTVPSFSELVGFIIDYYPSSVEIIEPEIFKEESRNVTLVLNDLISKIHRMDMQVKTLLAKNKILEKGNKKS